MSFSTHQDRIADVRRECSGLLDRAGQVVEGGNIVGVTDVAPLDMVTERTTGVREGLLSGTEVNPHRARTGRRRSGRRPSSRRQLFGRIGA